MSREKTKKKRDFWNCLMKASRTNERNRGKKRRWVGVGLGGISTWERSHHLYNLICK